MLKHMTVEGQNKKDAVQDVNFQVRKGEIVCITGIDGNGQTELVYGLSGLEPLKKRKHYHEGERHYPYIHPSAFCYGNESYTGRPAINMD